MAVNKCIKYSLFVFNLLFWVSGCIILGASIYLKITNEAVLGVDLLIAAGAIIMVMGFLGCCGAIQENRCLLLLFFIGLLLIFILLLAAGIIGAVNGDKAFQMEIVLGIAFGIASLLIFGMAFSMALYCQIGS